MFRMTLELCDTSCPIEVSNIRLRIIIFTLNFFSQQTLTCEETPTTVVETCEVAVWEKSWENFIKLHSFDCKRKVGIFPLYLLQAYDNFFTQDKTESSYKNKQEDGSELHRVKLTKGVSNAKITTFDQDEE